ncbi:transglycosylase domain-containing protein [Magnetococcales bacterium HHB-1]
MWYWPRLPDRQHILDADRGMVILVEKKADRLAVVETSHTWRIPGDTLPSHLKAAFVAVEDRRFYYHPGIDPVGMITTIIRASQGKRLGGGSTITQQLAKNLFLSSKRSLGRKLREMVLAFKLEYFFTKERILELYLNNIFFGDQIFGIETAARYYFAKRARDLNLYESAMLAGMVKGPNRYHPKRAFKRADKRARLILRMMVDDYTISPKEQQTAIAQGVQRGDRAWQSIQSHYFIDWITNSARSKIKNNQGRFRLFTTLNPEYQMWAEHALGRTLRRYQHRSVEEGALVALAQNGAVRAMVGGQNYRQSQLNRVLAKRQPASTLKPFIFLAALEAGMKPNSWVEDRPIAVQDWRPRNHDNRFLGRMQLQDALAKSRNTVAVDLAQRFGYQTLTALLKRLGWRGASPLNQNPTTALGSREVKLLDLTALYLTVANRGMSYPPFGLFGITDTDGQVIYWQQREGRFFDGAPRHLQQLAGMLQRAVFKGTGRQAAFGDRPVAGKTGTSQGYRDALFVGFTDRLTAGVWVGNDDNRPMKNITGGSIPAQVWRSFMANCHDSLYEPATIKSH